MLACRRRQMPNLRAAYSGTIFGVDMSQNISITINGESRQSMAETIAALVREIGLKPEKVAVEHNGEIAPRSTLENAALGDGDVLEIVHFVGGG